MSWPHYWLTGAACCCTGDQKPVELSESVRGWVTDMRKQVQAIMGVSAGIVRTQDSLQDGLQHMMHLVLEAQVSVRVLRCPCIVSPWLVTCRSQARSGFFLSSTHAALAASLHAALECR